MRALAQYRTGYVNDSTSLVEVRADFSGFAVPEMGVFGNGQEIPSGSTAASTANNTDFDAAAVLGGVAVRTFTISNTGAATLALSGVQVLGAHAGDFTITAAPALTMPPGESTSFQVTFDPRDTGVREARLQIASDDADEGAYVFALAGTGTGPAPEIVITGNGFDLPNGNYHFRTEDFTDFGDVVATGGASVRSYTIANAGNALLSLAGVSFTGLNSADFTMTQPPTTTSLAPGGSTTIQVTFDPGAIGSRFASLVIANDDGDESPYLFEIMGTGVQAGFDDLTLQATPNDPPLTMALQTDGRIVIGGSFTALGSTNRNRLARFLPDGTLDSAYNPNANGTVHATLLQPDGKLIVGGGFHHDGRRAAQRPCATAAGWHGGPEFRSEYQRRRGGLRGV